MAAPTAPPAQVRARQGTRLPLPPQAANVNIRGGTAGKSGDLECQIR